MSEPAEEAPAAAHGAHPPRVMTSGMRRALKAGLVAAALSIVFLALWTNLTHSLAAGRFTAWSAGRLCGLLAATLFVYQFAMSSRLKLLDRAFALNNLLVAHARVGPTAVMLAVFHPVILLVLAGAGGSLDVPDKFFEGVGAVALVVVMATAATSIWRPFFELSFESWRRIHQLNFVIILLVGVHSLALGRDVSSGWPLVFWVVLLGACASLFVWVKIVKPRRLRARRYLVRAVERVSHDTWNLTLAPERGERFDYMPGQFAFLRLFGEKIAPEEHPFTISSAPTRPGEITFTIKESGDFTRTLGGLAAGDTATVDAPYGHFSYLVKASRDEDLLMIAGGVGITPLLSMMRNIAATGDPRRVTLVWGNKAEDDILLREEIEGFSSRITDFRFHHILSAQEDWPGEKGFVTGEALRRLLCDDELARRVFLCGPPVMMGIVTAALVGLGVPRRRIHTERFAL